MRAACDQINVIHNAYLSMTTFQYKVLNNVNRNHWKTFLKWLNTEKLEMLYEQMTNHLRSFDNLMNCSEDNHKSLEGIQNIFKVMGKLFITK